MYPGRDPLVRGTPKPGQQTRTVIASVPGSTKTIDRGRPTGDRTRISARRRAKRLLREPPDRSPGDRGMDPPRKRQPGNLLHSRTRRIPRGTGGERVTPVPGRFPRTRSMRYGRGAAVLSAGTPASPPPGSPNGGPVADARIKFVCRYDARFLVIRDLSRSRLRTPRLAALGVERTWPGSIDTIRTGRTRPERGPAATGPDRYRAPGGPARRQGHRTTEPRPLGHPTGVWRSE